MINKLSTVVLALAVASCAVSLPYSTNYPMTNTTVRSRDGLLNGKIPQGWFSATEDSLGTALTMLLISDAAGATLSVKEIKLDRISARQTEELGLALLASISASSRLVGSGTTASELQAFEVHNKKFCSYELTEGVIRVRVVVFSAKGKYYECEARGGSNDWNGEQYTSICTTQQTFLSSLTY